MTLKGVIGDFFETGCEGVMWYFFEDGYTGYESFRNIANGDHLKIFGQKDEILFDGIIEKDKEAGWMPYWHIVRKYKNSLKRRGRGKLFIVPCDYMHGQPCALGFWIHWTQKGWDPDEWAKLFFAFSLEGTNDRPLRAELTKKTKTETKD